MLSSIYDFTYGCPFGDLTRTAQLVARQTRKYGRAIITPDILFLDHVFIDGIQIYWIDVKDMICSDVQFIYASAKKQAAKYHDKWGIGAIVYMHGIVDKIEIPGAIICDGTQLFHARIRNVFSTK